MMKNEIPSGDGFIEPYLKPCSTCGNPPKLHVWRYSKSLMDPHTIVDHFTYQCDDCDRKHGNSPGACYQTFPWADINDAVEEWNSIVELEMSWYKKQAES